MNMRNMPTVELGKYKEDNSRIKIIDKTKLLVISLLDYYSARPEECTAEMLRELRECAGMM